MIISVSRRTDIPAFYVDWFLNRIKAGYVDVINPFNPKQANRLSLKKEDVDCFVFWSKNPKPLLDRIDELDGYNYYFQYTLNSYGTDLEPSVPSKSNELIDTFIRLSERIGKKKVIWRYDPIILTKKYNKEYHIKYFEALASKLHNYTNKVVISFVDNYVKTTKTFKELGITELSVEDMNYIADAFSKIAKKYNLELVTCCEKIDLDKYGIKHNTCIDGNLIRELFGIEVSDKKDAQRDYCNCVKCNDIGAYDTCMHQCRYCYANTSNEAVASNMKLHNPNSSVLIGELEDDVKLYEVKVTRGRKVERTLFDD